MPSIKLDGREIPFEAGDTIIKAAHRAGIDIPHYCWHPGLSVAANCRMCLVEILPAAGQRAMRLEVERGMAMKDASRLLIGPRLSRPCKRRRGKA